MTEQAKIVLSAEDKTRAAFASAKRNLGDLEKAGILAGRAMAGIGAGLSAAGLVAFVKTSIDAADAMGKLSTKTGIMVEDLSGWQHVMDLSGVKTEQFEMAVGKLNTTLAKSPEKLAKLGITAKEPHEAMLQLADAFSRMDDPARRAAIASDLFGEEVGRKLVVAMSQGRQAMEAQIRAGQELLPMTKELAEQSAKFNAELSIMRARFDGVGVSLSANFLKPMGEFLDLVDDYGPLAGVLAGIGAAVLPGVEAHDLTEKARAQREVNDALKEYGDAKRYAKSKIGELFPEYSAEKISDAKKRLDQAIAVNRSYQAVAARRDAALAKMAGGGGVDTKGYFSGGNSANKDEKRLPIIQPLDNIMEAFKVDQEAVRKFIEEQQNDINDLQRGMAEDNQKAIDDYASRLQSLVSDTTLAKTERLQSDIDFLNQAFFTGMIGSQQYEEAIASLTGKAKEQVDVMKTLMEDLAKQVQSSLADFLFDPFQDGLDGMVAGFARTMQRILANALATDLTNAIFKNGGLSLPGSDQNLLGSFASLFGFATGGIMTANGPLPLHKYASGGIANSPQLALFGEGRSPEAFVPLPDGRSIPVKMQGGGQAAAPNIRIINAYDSAHVGDYMASPSGEKIILNAIRRNAGALRGVLQ